MPSFFLRPSDILMWVLLAYALILCYFHRRREKRLSRGWRLERKDGFLSWGAGFLSSICVWIAIGGYVMQAYRISPAFFLGLGFLLFVLRVILPDAKWIPPTPDSETDRSFES